MIFRFYGFKTFFVKQQIDTESRVHFEEPEDKRRKVSLGSSPESEENEDKDASNYPAKLLEMPDDQVEPT